MFMPNVDTRQFHTALFQFLFNDPALNKNLSERRDFWIRKVTEKVWEESFTTEEEEQLGWETIKSRDEWQEIKEGRVDDCEDAAPEEHWGDLTERLIENNWKWSKASVKIKPAHLTH